jgi:hypothetical protein
MTETATRRNVVYKVGTCNGCSKHTNISYGLCYQCKLTPRHRRPNFVREGRNVKYHFQRYPKIFCGCDYMEASLEEPRPHDGYACANPIVVNWDGTRG